MKKTTQNILWRIAACAAMSIAILGGLFLLVTKAKGRNLDLADLFAVLKSAAVPLLTVYFLLALGQAFFRGWRYRVLIGAAQADPPPPMRQMFLITLVRNMLVDMLPARIGALSYIALLNRGCRVRADVCLSSFAISIVFDTIALALLVAGIAIWQLATATLPSWMFGACICLIVITLIMIVCIVWGFDWALWILRRLAGPTGGHRLIRTLIKFTRDIRDAVLATRKAGCLLTVLGLSFCVRLIKYTGLYCLFWAVVGPTFPGLRDISAVAVVASLFVAEISASLPVPTFMGFGTYEFGGMLALMALGFTNYNSMLAMFGIHLWSQLMDYAIGGAGFVSFLFVSRTWTTAEKRQVRRALIVFVAAGLVLLAGVLVGYRQWKKHTADRHNGPATTGEAITRSKNDEIRLQNATGALTGFVVWSSSRTGNHEIFQMTFPDRRVRQLTRSPHSDFFPRVAPNGKHMVFARSKDIPSAEAWIGQREYERWDVVIMDLETGKERRLAKDGTTPTWSEDGTAVYFQRHGNTMVQHRVSDGHETVLFEAGTGTGDVGTLLSPRAMFETPAYSTKTGTMAVTLRKGQRGTSLISRANGAWIQLFGGCQLAWAPDAAYLYYIDKGGRQVNQVFRVDPTTRKRHPWLDLPGAYSHEYFPKVSNDGRYLVLGASTGDHAHDRADYEIFLWKIGDAAEHAVRLTYHTGNDCWPDIHLPTE